MERFRYGFCSLLLVAAGAGLIGCQGDPRPTAELPALTRAERVDRALGEGAAFLLRGQSADGAWRSDTYPQFKDGTSLTPLVVNTLLALPPSGEIEAAARKGAAYLAGLVHPGSKEDATPADLPYPVYTAAGAVIALSHPTNSRYRPARDAWLAFLRRRQLTEELGWRPADKEYGGWGYSHELPRKPAAGETPAPFTESNLSATAFALEAFRSAGVPSDDAAVQKALVFVERCQNFNNDPARADPAFDDGGFFFIYDDPVRNKAGGAGKDRTGRERFHSYGSTTADGLRALLACGLAPEHPRVAVARRWLHDNFDPARHPGRYPPAREASRAAVYYYYCCSLARALRRTGGAAADAAAEPRGWAEALSTALLLRQEKNGSWVNDAVVVREDDPVVATCLAARALTECRLALRRSSPSERICRGDPAH